MFQKGLSAILLFILHVLWVKYSILFYFVIIALVGNWRFKTTKWLAITTVWILKKKLCLYSALLIFLWKYIMQPSYSINRLKTCKMTWCNGSISVCEAVSTPDVSYYHNLFTVENFWLFDALNANNLKPKIWHCFCMFLILFSDSLWYFINLNIFGCSSPSNKCILHGNVASIRRVAAEGQMV